MFRLAIDFAFDRDPLDLDLDLSEALGEDFDLGVCVWRVSTPLEADFWVVLRLRPEFPLKNKSFWMSFW